MSLTTSVTPVSTKRVTIQRQKLGNVSVENCSSNPRIKENWLKKKRKKPTPYLCPPRFVLGSAESKITNYWTIPLCLDQLICWT